VKKYVDCQSLSPRHVLRFARMQPSKFIAYQERRIGRRFTADEAACIEAARAACPGGKRDTVKAMWAALKECLPPADFAKVKVINA
jgi:hypothetical protein